ncbi:MAG TPA: hypothetical protein VLS45_00700 [Methylomicrobium sp.]|nr:hypothetical protein [Methylomicrobium sp.]
MSEGSDGEPIVTGDPENLNVAVEMLIQSVTEQEIQALLAWGPPSCVSGVGRCRRVLAVSPLR